MAAIQQEADIVASVIESKKTKDGVDLATLSLLSPVLVVFLRHAGCMFCRETVEEIARLRPSLEEAGIRIALVHHGRSNTMERLLRDKGLAGLDRIYDGDRSLYRAFGLRRGKPSQVFGFSIWPKALSALRKYGAGVPAGDPFQMPGVFLLHRCEILHCFRHRKISDKPDYIDITSRFIAD
ncbi:MAG: AhpC/TSA family protein [Bryobacterales bacterium]|nr:AhpC/TSA family protein [Bryobacterales bacterium]